MGSKRGGRRSGRATSDADSSASTSDDGSDDSRESDDSSSSDHSRSSRRHKSRRRRRSRSRSRDRDESTDSRSASSDDTDDSSSDDRGRSKSRGRRGRSSSRRRRSSRRSSSSSSSRHRHKDESTSDSRDSRSYSSSPSRSVDDEEQSSTSSSSSSNDDDDRTSQHADAELAPRAKGDLGTTVIVPSANIFHQFCKDMSVFLSHFMTQSIDSYEQKHRVSREDAILAFVRIIVAPVSNLSEGLFDEIFKRCVAPTGTDDEARNTCSHFMSSLQYAAANFIYPDSPSLQIARDVRYGSGGAGVTKTRIQGSRFDTQALGRKTGHIGFVFECSANRQAFITSSPPCLDIEVFLIGCLSHFVKRNVLINSGDASSAPSSTTTGTKGGGGGRSGRQQQKQQQSTVGVNMIYFDLSSYQMLTELMAASVKDNLCTCAKETTYEAPIWKKRVNFANHPFSVATVRFMGVNAQANEDRRAVAAKLSHKVQDTLDRITTDLSSQKRHLKRGLASQQQDLKGIMKKAAKEAKKLQLQKAAEQIIRKDKKRRESQRKRKKRKAAEYARKRKAAAAAAKKNQSNGSAGDNINVKVGDNKYTAKKKKKKDDDDKKKKKSKKKKHKKDSSAASSSSSGDNSSSDNSSSDSLSSSSSLFSSSD